MKQILILLVTLAIIIIPGLWEISYLKESSNYFLADINNLYQISQREEYQLAKTEAESVKETWNKIEKTWALFIDDRKMYDIEEELISFVSYIESKDEIETNASYNRLKNSIKEISEYECLNAENIF